MKIDVWVVALPGSFVPELIGVYLDEKTAQDTVEFGGGIAVSIPTKLSTRSSEGGEPEF
ncbi:hypothetical protein ACF1AJ_11260 [Leifsonia sp. NPDC014704]|uniref:hypothetical protein n=1 Tax=Leifsonia sp. NPDC014704 TaxID=3364123 RepID=UPI0036F48101